MKYEVQENCLTIFLPENWIITMQKKSGNVPII